MLEPKGIQVHDKTIKVQVICLLAVAIMNAVLFITKLIFLKQCVDKVEDYSVSGLISRVLTLGIMFLWRIITVTMCVFIMRQAKQLSYQD